MKHGKDFYSWLRQVSQINERLYKDAALISRLLGQCSVRLDDLKLMGFSDIDFGEDEWIDLRSRVDRIKSQWGRVAARVYRATEKHKCRHCESEADNIKASQANVGGLNLMMKLFGEIDIHDLRNLPSNYKFKDLNDEAEFYVIRTFYPETEDGKTWPFESKWFATEGDAERYFRKDWSFDKGTKPKADIVKVKLTISKQVRLM